VKFQKLCVLGLGYIGLPTASTFATHGVEVVGVDVNEKIIETLKSGGLHIHEPGLGELVAEAVQTGMLRVATRPEPADAFIIAVPTPFYDSDKRADMRAVKSATEAITPHLQKGNLVVLESTSPPRTTTDLIVPILEKSGLKAGIDFHLAYSPERVLPGQILRELIENARVVGGITPESAQAGYELYATFVKGDIIKTNATTAEMVKLMENTYRDVNIAIANEFSQLADSFGIDVWEAISLANLHPRVEILRPGPGVGGHCISVDPWFLVEAAPEKTPLIRTAREVNDAQPQFVVKLVERALGSLEGKKIAALGLSYKPNVDDLRESPAVEVVHLLQGAGASVKTFEPFAPNATLSGLETVSTLKEALAEADAILLLVAHSQFKELDAENIAKMMSGRVAVDAINGWNVKQWQEAGFELTRLGVGK
jgi:UDP-N-acetyl-D-mannosaminuronic acid dehydrogenase